MATEKRTDGPTFRGRHIAAMNKKGGVSCPYQTQIPDRADNTGTVPIEVQAQFALAHTLIDEANELVRQAQQKADQAAEVRATALAHLAELDPRAGDFEHVFIGKSWRVAYGGRSQTADVSEAERAIDVEALAEIIGQGGMSATDGHPFGGKISIAMATPGDLAEMLGHRAGRREVDLGGLSGIDISAAIARMRESTRRQITDPDAIRAEIESLSPAQRDEAISQGEALPADIAAFIKEPVGDVPAGLVILDGPIGKMIGIDQSKRAN